MPRRPSLVEGLEGAFIVLFREVAQACVNPHRQSQGHRGVSFIPNAARTAKRKHLIPKTVLREGLGGKDWNRRKKGRRRRREREREREISINLWNMSASKIKALSHVTLILETLSVTSV